MRFALLLGVAFSVSVLGCGSTGSGGGQDAPQALPRVEGASVPRGEAAGHRRDHQQEGSHGGHCRHPCDRPHRDRPDEGIKLLVLYPHPTDPEAFEAYYLSKHVPLMYGFDVITYRTVNVPAVAPDGNTPFYRVAEIPFRSVTHFNEFMQTEQARIALEDAIKISTGGPPVLVLGGVPDPRVVCADD